MDRMHPAEIYCLILLYTISVQVIRRLNYVITIKPWHREIILLISLILDSTSLSQVRVKELET